MVARPRNHLNLRDDLFDRDSSLFLPGFGNLGASLRPPAMDRIPARSPLTSMARVPPSGLRTISPIKCRPDEPGIPSRLRSCATIRIGTAADADAAVLRRPRRLAEEHIAPDQRVHKRLREGAVAAAIHRDEIGARRQRLKTVVQRDTDQTFLDASILATASAR